jgi:hypothetical protein
MSTTSRDFGKNPQEVAKSPSLLTDGHYRSSKHFGSEAFGVFAFLPGYEALLSICTASTMRFYRLYYSLSIASQQRL